MLPQRSLQSRYLRTARAAYLARLVAAGAIVMIPAACGGSDDASVFEAADTGADSGADSSSTGTVAPTADSAADSVAGDSSDSGSATETATATTPATTSATTPATAATATGATFPAGGELVIDFTYAADSTAGRVRNPYVAVWVEDTAGNYVSTVAVWYEQSNKGLRYLSDLRAWIAASDGQVATTSTGATRSPGQYSVVWDGTDLDGNPVAQGDYVVFVEAAREHGPYEVTSAPITLGDAGATVAIPDNGELSALTATLTV